MNHLAKLRKEAGLTQGQLAERIGVTASAIKAWENGRRTPSSKCMTALYQALDLNPEDIARIALAGGWP